MSEQGSTCTWDVAETIPYGVSIPPVSITIYQGWLDVIRSARSTLDIACMYFTLTQGSQYNDTHAYEGQDIFNAVVDAKNRGVTVRVVSVTPPFEDETDLVAWEKIGVQVRRIPWKSMFVNGILHSKYLIADSNHGYVGSANFDWRALVHTKEIGSFFYNCTIFSQDLQKIFEIYWILGDSTKIPPSYPPSLDTKYNLNNPGTMWCNGANAPFFLASSPVTVNTPSRTNDIDAMVSVIDNAKINISASVMDYTATFLYTKLHEFWPRLDNAIRNASARGVKIRLLFGNWEHTNPSTLQWQKSLAVLDNVQAKFLIIPPPPDGKPIPYTRVSHSKYLTSDSTAYITTSNWTPDYFMYTAGVSLTYKCGIYRSVVEEIFNRDWNSPYTKPVFPSA